MTIVASKQVIGGEEVVILVEVDDGVGPASAADWGGGTRADRASKVIDATRDVFGDGLALARDSAARAVQSWRDMTEEVRPDSYQLQLAIKLDIEAGAVIAKLGAGAQLQVTMTWENRREQ